MEPRFEVGLIVATPSALDVLGRAGQSPQEFVERHVQGDWGLVSNEDHRLNDQAIELGERVISAYETEQSERIWVITEADRSATTLLTPEEY